MDSHLIDARDIASRIGADGDTKLNAAADFTARLLNSPAGASIARIMLFGSVARGEARPDSDVDVMVFTTAPLSTTRDYTAQAAWDASAAWGEVVAQVTFSLDDLLLPQTYVVYLALEQGKELYTMEPDEIRRLEAGKLLRKAQLYIQQAERSEAQGDFELAIVGAYNAVELIGKALVLLKQGVDLPVTHGGMIQILSREYIRPGEVPAEWARLLNRGLEIRSYALYNTMVTIDAADVKSLLALGRDMCNFLDKKLIP
jgi:uncharacterized protein (UPF0332 family)